MWKSKKTCKHCGSLGHTEFNCPRKARKPLQTRSQLKPKKRMRKLGKIGRTLALQRQTFLEEHDPPYLCVYCLVIGIDVPLLPEEFDVEHGESKTRHPDKRFAKTNLYVGCKYHNREKSSMDIDEYIEKLRKLREEYETNQG